MFQVQLIEFSADQGDQISGKISFFLKGDLFPALQGLGAVGLDLVKHAQKLCLSDRLENIIHAAVLDGLSGIFEITVAAEDDKIGVGNVFRPYFFQKLYARHGRHFDVGDNQIHLCFFQKCNGFQTVRRRSCKRKALFFPINQHGQALQYKRFVIY